MSRLKTLGTYVLIVVAFFFFSTFAADVILNNSYNNLSNTTEITKSEEGLNVETVEVKANRRQGSFTGRVVNTSSSTIAICFILCYPSFAGSVPVSPVSGLPPAQILQHAGYSSLSGSITASRYRLQDRFTTAI